MAKSKSPSIIDNKQDREYEVNARQILINLSGGVQPSALEVEEMVKRLKKEAGELEGSLKDLQRGLQSTGNVFGSLGTAIKAPVAGLAQLGALFGAGGLTVGKSLEVYNSFQNQLRASASQFTKYGQGISETKKQVEGLAQSFRFTRAETIQLMSAYEGGFNFSSMKGMKSVLDQIGDSVGRNKEAMASMLQSIQGIVGKSQLFTNMFGAISASKGGIQANLKLIEQSGFAMAAAGELSVQEAKKLDEFLRGGEANTKEDREQKASIDEQTRAYRSINKFFEDFQMDVGGKLQPLVKTLTGAVERNSNSIIKIGSELLIFSSGFTLLSSIFKGLSGSLLGTSGLLRDIRGILSLFARGGAIGRIGGGIGGLLPGAGGFAAGSVRGGLLAGAGGAGTLTGGLAIAGGALAAGGAGYLAGRYVPGAMSYIGQQTGLLNKDESVDNTTGAIGSTLVGGAAGAAIGSLILPGIGTIVGGLIGGVGGIVTAYFEGEGKAKAKAAGEKAQQDISIKFRDQANELELRSLGIGKAVTSTGRERDLNEGDKQEARFERSEILPVRKELEEAQSSGDTKQADYLKQKLQILETQLSTIKQENKAVEDLRDKYKDILTPLTEYTIRVKSVEEVYKRQNDYLQSQLGLIEGIVGLLGMTRELGANESKAISQQIDSYLAASDQTIAANEKFIEVIRSGIVGGPINIPEAMNAAQKISAMPQGEEKNFEERKFEGQYGLQIGALTNYNKALTENIRLRQERTRVSEIVAKEREPGLQQIERETSLLEAQMQLANSYGFGLRATVQMQQQVVKSLGDQKNIVREQISDQEGLLQSMRTRAEERLAAANSLPEGETKVAEIQRIQRDLSLQEFNIRNTILQKQTQITQMTAKQAELTKSLREGYISAIAAMTTGAGVFSRIVISQEQRLGSLVFGAPKRIRALRAGSELEGRRESGRFGLGSLTEGKAGEAEKATLSQYGEFMEAGDIRKGAEAIMNYQQEVGNKMSGAMVAVSNNAYGTAQALEEHRKASESTAASITKLGAVADRVASTLGSQGNSNVPTIANIPISPNTNVTVPATNATTVSLPQKAFTPPSPIETLVSRATKSVAQLPQLPQITNVTYQSKNEEVPDYMDQLSMADKNIETAANKIKEISEKMLSLSDSASEAQSKGKEITAKQFNEQSDALSSTYEDAIRSFTEAQEQRATMDEDLRKRIENSVKGQSDPGVEKYLRKQKDIESLAGAKDESDIEKLRQSQIERISQSNKIQPIKKSIGSGIGVGSSLTLPRNIQQFTKWAYNDGPSEAADRAGFADEKITSEVNEKQSSLSVHKIKLKDIEEKLKTIQLNKSQVIIPLVKDQPLQKIESPEIEKQTQSYEYGPPAPIQEMGPPLPPKSTRQDQFKAMDQVRRAETKLKAVQVQYNKAVQHHNPNVPVLEKRISEAKQEVERAKENSSRTTSEYKGVLRSKQSVEMPFVNQDMNPSEGKTVKTATPIQDDKGVAFDTWSEIGTDTKEGVSVLKKLLENSEKSGKDQGGVADLARALNNPEIVRVLTNAFSQVATAAANAAVDKAVKMVHQGS